jgi:hypothetical protein
MVGEFVRLHATGDCVGFDLQCLVDLVGLAMDLDQCVVDADRWHELGTLHLGNHGTESLRIVGQPIGIGDCRVVLIGLCQSTSTACRSSRRAWRALALGLAQPLYEKLASSFDFAGFDQRVDEMICA